MKQSQADRFFFRPFLFLIIHFVVLGVLHAEDDEMEMLDFEMNIEELTGKERDQAVRKLCASDDPDLDVLYSLLLSGQDSAETKELLFGVLSKRASPEAFDQAKELAESGDIKVKRYGVRLLGLTRHPRVVAALTRLLDTKFMCNKGDIVDALGDTADRKAIPPLRKIRDSDKNLRKRSVFSLMRLGDREVLTEFFAIYGKMAAKLRHLYVYLPWARSSKTRRQIERVEQDIRDHERDVGLMCELLLQAPKSFIPDISAYLKGSSDPYAITLIFDNLAEMITPENAADFLPLMEHRSSVLAQAVVERAREVGGKPVETKIARSLLQFRSSDDKYLRLMAVQNWRLLPAEEGLKALTAGLTDPSRLIRIEAARQLRRAGQPQVLPALKQALSATEDVVMRGACRAAIYEIENPVTDR